MRWHYTEDMAEKRRPTINSILKDPAASDWLKAAVRSALECDPADVMRDAQTLVTLMIGRHALNMPVAIGIHDGA
jgi:hypothetical protein